jgi:NAD(P)-dependent dehydrogenase (short-subunit alcohol dehydrogenase family)
MGYQPLKGQKALVTGASSGIGLGVAKALGAAGADVVVNYVSAPEKAEQVAEEIRAGGSRALAIRADVSRPDQVQAMFREMLAAWGTIDILVNNAGLQKDAAFSEMTAGVAHQNGTVRFGHDPRASVLDVNCRAHEVDNLYVVDGSFFPSSAAVNPALTIMANALRVADHLKTRLGVRSYIPTFERSDRPGNVGM